MLMLNKNDMSCKSCKSKKVAETFNGVTTSVQKSIIEQQNKVKSNLWDDSMGKLTSIEQIILVLFAWIPLIIGYITIIRFLISMF